MGNPNKLEEGETDSQGGKQIHFLVLIDGKQTSATSTVLLPQQSASGFKAFDLSSGFTVAVNAGSGRGPSWTRLGLRQRWRQRRHGPQRQQR